MAKDAPVERWLNREIKSTCLSRAQVEQGWEVGGCPRPLGPGGSSFLLLGEHQLRPCQMRLPRKFALTPTKVPYRP